MRVSVVIAAHNEGVRLLKTLESLYETSTGIDFETIVIDDGSTDGAVAAATRDYPRIKLLKLSERQGPAAAKDFGADEAKGDTLVFLDAHTKPEQGAVQRLVEQVERLTGQAVLVPRVPSLDPVRWRNSRSQFGYGYAINLWTFSTQWKALRDLKAAGPDRPGLYESPALIGCAFAIDHDLYDRLWGQDVHMRNWGVEDIDLGLKAWLAGYPVLLDPTASIGHRFQSQFDSYQISAPQLVANQLRMARKNFTESVWTDWLQLARARFTQATPDAPEGIWAQAWMLFEKDRASAEHERTVLMARRVRDEFSYAEYFGLEWPVIAASLTIDDSGQPNSVGSVAQLKQLLARGDLPIELAKRGLLSKLGMSPSPSPSPSPPPQSSSSGSSGGSSSESSTSSSLPGSSSSGATSSESSVSDSSEASSGESSESSGSSLSSASSERSSGSRSSQPSESSLSSQSTSSIHSSQSGGTSSKGSGTSSKGSGTGSGSGSGGSSSGPPPSSSSSDQPPCKGCKITRSSPEGDGPVLIGQKIQVSIGCDSGDVSDITWTIPATAVRDYIVVNIVSVIDPHFSAEIIQLDSDYLSLAEVSFYWVTPGSKTVEVTFTVTIDGTPTQCNKTMTFDVRAPEITTSKPTSIGTVMAVPGTGGAPPGVELRNGTISPGIEFEAAVLTPSGFGGTGSWQFTQLAGTVAYYKIAATGSCDLKTGAEPLPLDNNFSYPGVESGPFSADGSSHTTSDSPATFANPAVLTQMVREAAFHMYILYRPPGENTIWVPLKTVGWAFSFCALPSILTPTWNVKNQDSSFGAWETYPSHPTWTKQTPLQDVTLHDQPCPPPCE